MGKRFSEISPENQTFIRQQKMFFVGTAAQEGRVNISPKGMDTLRVVNASKVVWLNLTGSGNETAAHLLKNDRMTIMFCAFEGKPMILRLYGTAHIYHQRDTSYQHLIELFPEIAGARQVIEMNVELVQESCGFAVPEMDFVEQRTILKDWAIKQGQDRIEQYWKDRNTSSIDGYQTNTVLD